jgi:hypothetical protein
MAGYGKCVPWRFSRRFAFGKVQLSFILCIQGNAYFRARYGLHNYSALADFAGRRTV